MMWTRWKLCFAFMSVTVAAAPLVDVQSLIGAFVAAAATWKDEQPLLAAAFSVLAVIVWILSFMPLTPLEVALGFLFGVRAGYIIVFIGKVMGCSIAFALGRTIARGWAKRQFGRHEILNAVDHAISQQPYKISFIVRLAYIPIALKNYGLALLSVQPQIYMVSLVVVELFNSSILVTVGSTTKDLSSLMSGKQPKTREQIGMMVLGCVFLLALLAYLSAFARRALHDAKLQKQRLESMKGQSEAHGTKDE